MDPYKRKVHILEEFTRFGGGQYVFEAIYQALNESSFNKVSVVTDSDHSYIPSYIPIENIIASHLHTPEWNRPFMLLPKILDLKKELKHIVPVGITINNHPNVFIFNATINFAHEIFGFLAHNPRKIDNFLMRLIKTSGIFKQYGGGYFLVQGDFTLRQTKQTFSKLGVTNTKIEAIDLPVHLPKSVSLDSKEKTVLTFGRISPDKKLETVLEIAKLNPKTKFIISGRLHTIDQTYFSYLDHNKPDNLSLLPNPDEDQKDGLFRRAKVYLHSKKNENYGLSVAEAISYGLCPVVPIEGGAYEDLLKNGKYGYGYVDTEDAKHKVDMALEASKSELHSILESRDRFSRNSFNRVFIEKLEMRT